MRFPVALAIFVIGGLASALLLPIAQSALAVWIAAVYMIIVYTPEVGIKNW